MSHCECFNCYEGKKKYGYTDSCEGLELLSSDIVDCKAGGSIFSPRMQADTEHRHETACREREKIPHEVAELEGASSNPIHRGLTLTDPL